MSDWTLPKFSTLVGNRTTAAPDDWCAEHSVPESICIECNTQLAPPETVYGWCQVHGISQCPLDHPDVAEVKSLPVVSVAEMESAARALALRPRTENNSLCKSFLKRIQFASDEALAKAGVDIDVVGRQPITESVVGNGELVYDQTTVTHLSSRAMGTVIYVEKQVGDRVSAGEVLALIDSSEIGEAKAKLLQLITQTRLAETTLERLRPLAAEGTISGRQLREADAGFQNSQAQLLGAQQALANLGLRVDSRALSGLSTQEIASEIEFLGIPPELSSVVAQQATSNLFALRAAQPGVVVERDVVVGEVVNSGTTLFTIADTSQLWVMLNVRQEEAKYVQLGQNVRFLPTDGSTEDEVVGQVSWISTAADEQTRTVQLRVAIANHDGRLRANTFGMGRVVLREEPQAIVIPSQAVHWDGDCTVVFVRDKSWFEPNSHKFFHVRTVRAGVQEDGRTEIIAGLLPGEVIASKNSAVLAAQLLKSNLGAGCGCAH